MYKEYRQDGFLKTISKTSPEQWGAHFSSQNGLTPYQELSFSLDHRWKVIKTWIGKGSGKRLLDAGCGAGEWVEFLNKNGIHAEGLDYSQDLISFLKVNRPEFIWNHGDIHNLPFESQTFDGIVSWGVIEHNEAGPVEALSEFARVLTPGGIAIVSVPFDSRHTRRASEYSFPQEKVKEIGGEFFQYYMTPEELKGFMKEAGFNVVLAQTFGGPSLAIYSPKMYKRFLNTSLFRPVNLLIKCQFWKGDLDHNVICVGLKA